MAAFSENSGRIGLCLSNGEDFSPYFYSTADDPDLPFNVFAQSQDPILSDQNSRQTFTYDEYLMKEKSWRSFARKTSNNALFESLSSFAGFKKYLKAQESSFALASMPPVQNPNQLAEKPALTWETWWGTSDVDLSFQEEIVFPQSFSIATIEYARMAAQKIDPNSSTRDNARMLIRDAENNWHLYVLNKPLYAAEFFHEYPEGFAWAPIFLNEQGAETLELYTSDGAVLEAVRQNDETGAHHQLHTKLAILEPDEIEKTNRIDLTSDFVTAYREEINALLDQVNSVSDVLRLQKSILALSSAEQKARFLALLLRAADPAEVLAAARARQEEGVRELVFNVDDPEPIIKWKIRAILELVTLDAEEIYQIICILAQKGLYGKLFQIMDGVDRIQLISVLASKNFTGLPPKEISSFDTVAQVFKRSADSFAGFVDLSKHPEQLEAIADFGFLAFRAISGGQEEPLAGRAVSSFEEATFLIDSFWNSFVKKYQAAKQMGHAQNEIYELQGSGALNTLIGGAITIIFGGNTIPSLKKAWRVLLSRPVGFLTGIGLGSFALHALLKDEYDAMTDFEVNLAQSIERAYDAYSEPFNKDLLVFKALAKLRRNIGFPIRPMSQYDHPFRVYSLQDWVKLPEFTQFLDLCDNNETVKWYYYEGVKNFQRDYGLRYYFQITKALKYLYKKAKEEAWDQYRLEVAINDYFEDHYKLIQLLNMKVDLDRAQPSAIEQIGIRFRHVDFPILLAYLDANSEIK